MGRGPTFHLSCYLTLGLAAVCLGFAEWFFLHWILWYLAGLCGLFAVAWKVEGRWHLSEQGANFVGLAIAFGMIGWILFQWPRNEAELIATQVPWPAGLLPHLGPLLMILTAVKVFRPKAVADFWILQILGIMMVTLASVLAGTADHGLWVFLYLASLVWCLMLFQRMQPTWAGLSDEQRRRAPLFPPETLTSQNGGVGPLQDVSPAAACAVMATCLGAVLFLVAPRFASLQWIPHKLSTGAAGRIDGGLESGMDLNRVGKIELSDEVAFEVAALDAAGNAVPLSPDIYWRGETLDLYRAGRWYPSRETTYDSADGAEGTTDRMPSKALWKNNPDKPANPRTPPDNMPAGKTHLTIHVLKGKTGHLVLAEPLNPKHEAGRAPIIGRGPSSANLFSYLLGADTIEPPPRAWREPYVYGQIVDFGANARRQPAGPISDLYLRRCFEQTPPAELVDWSRTLLARQDTLTAEEKTLDKDSRVPPAHRAKVAQAICQHFAGSGEYLYSLNLRRVDASIDVNVDFLLNVKEGHCERYASGLALTLRGLGIPTRVVHGFHGCETDESGSVVVRFNQAHSWVQALAPSADGKGNDWLLLDPTPSQEAPLDRWQAFCEWIESGLGDARTAFRTFVLDYGSEQQKVRLRGWWGSLTAALSHAATIPVGLAVAALVGTWLGRKRLARWWTHRQTTRLERLQLPWLADALAIVADKTGLSPEPHQTLLEFAAQLRGFTAMAPAFEALALLANRVRFGQSPLTADEQRDVANHIERLRSPAAAQQPGC